MDVNNGDSMMFDKTVYRCEVCGCPVSDGCIICDNCGQKIIEKPFWQCDICGCLVSDGHTICDDCDKKWWDNYKKKNQKQEKDTCLSNDDYDDYDDDDNDPGWPSTTGNPSGGGRNNGPR